MNFHQMNNAHFMKKMNGNNAKHEHAKNNAKIFEEIDGGSRNSNSLEDFNDSWTKILKTPQLPRHQIFEEKQEHPSFLTSRRGSMEEYSEDEHFENMDFVENDVSEKIKLARFLKKYENKLSAIALWCGHTTLGLIPSIFCANKSISLPICMTLTFLFMLTMFVFFMYFEGIKICNELEIDFQPKRNIPVKLKNKIGLLF